MVRSQAKDEGRQCIAAIPLGKVAERAGTAESVYTASPIENSTRDDADVLEVDGEMIGIKLLLDPALYPISRPRCVGILGFARA